MRSHLRSQQINDLSELCALNTDYLLTAAQHNSWITQSILLGGDPSALIRSIKETCRTFTVKSVIQISPFNLK